MIHKQPDVVAIGISSCRITGFADATWVQRNDVIVIREVRCDCIPLFDTEIAAAAEQQNSGAAAASLEIDAVAAQRQVIRACRAAAGAAGGQHQPGDDQACRDEHSGHWRSGTEMVMQPF